MEILHFEDVGIQVSFGCERSCSSARRVGGCCGRGRGDDAKTIISPNTSFSDIIKVDSNIAKNHSSSLWQSANAVVLVLGEYQISIAK